MNDLNSSPSVAVCPPLSAGTGCRRRGGFSLVEVLVVVTLLSLIVLVLMTVFNSTQSAFRAGVTQTDVLEGSRAAMELVVSDLKLMSPAGGPTNYNLSVPLGYYDINFFASLNNNENANYSLPLIQNLPGGAQQRTNLLENIFWVSRQNINGHDSWVGTGYTVIATNSSPLFPLYRFVTNAPASTDPSSLLYAYIAAIQNNAFTNTGWSHLIDGVLDFRVQPFDLNGYGMTNSYQYNAGQYTTYPNTTFFPPPQYGVTGFYFLSNAIPGSVEIQMSSLEDAVLRRAESFGAPGIAQSNYLAQQAGRVHVFRQRVILPNVDPSAYP
jgi:prepilin-type N-terminal cleavage/methylation domain-containing protein